MAAAAKHPAPIWITLGSAGGAYFGWLVFRAPPSQVHIAPPFEVKVASREPIIELPPRAPQRFAAPATTPAATPRPSRSLTLRALQPIPPGGN